MKGFLFDENLPRQILFKPSLPVTHATSINSNPTDTEVSDHAKAQGLVIVTKDADFYHRFLATVWPRIEKLLSKHKLVTVDQHRLRGVR